MQIEFILLAVLFSYLRNFLKKNNELPQWQNLFLAGLVFSIVMLFVEMTNPGLRKVTVWISHILTLALIYLIFKKSEFESFKSKIYIILPLVAVNFAEDFVKLISNSLYDNLHNYFKTASLFAVIWLISMLIISNKQKKSLEKERLKAAEREKELEITAALKAQLEIQVSERTSELTLQKEELEKTILDLKATQSQLIQSEKMASLGELTAGIAHEIQNPLNFVNNFAEVNSDIIEDMKTELQLGNTDEVIALANDIKTNNEKIAHHGKRADSIVKGMLQHSRKSSGIKEPTDINALADECMRLSYHGLRAKDKSFNASFKTNFDESLEKVNVVPQDIGRVLLNLFNNSFYAVAEKKQQFGDDFEPLVTVTTLKQIDSVLITIWDNGNGIPPAVLDKIYQPFYTTKPAGKGTGLGLSMSYEIITKGHQGKLTANTKEGEYAAFNIEIPME